ncbi:MAG: DNA gyrase inhibitor YacG [Moraxellaceae bacterium]
MTDKETNVASVACPHCSKPVKWLASEKFRPFCSERCKLIDFGAWADESHRIPGDNKPPNNDFED